MEEKGCSKRPETGPGKDDEIFSGTTGSRKYTRVVERLEELLGAIEWLKTDQARKGGYRFRDELNGLMSSMEKLLQTMEELSKTRTFLDNVGGNLSRLLRQVEAEIQSLTADRVAINGTEIESVRAILKQMEQEVRERQTPPGPNS